MKNSKQKIESTETKGGQLHLLTVAEVAEWLRVHRTTITGYAKSGELKSYKIGTRRLFKVEDVIVFLEARVDKEYVFGGCDR